MAAYWRERRGFTLLQVLTVMGIAALLITIAVPALNSIRLASAHASAEEALVAKLSRARWMAINSGQPRTVELTSPVVLTIRDPGGNALVATDFSQYGVTLGSSVASVDLDARGFLPTATPSVTYTVTSAPISQTATVTLGPLGKVER